jgi:hypothetical protein
MGLLLLAALLLCGCGGQAEVIDNVVPTSQVIEIRPDPSATPMPVVTPAPAQTLIPVTTPAPTMVPTAAPTSLPVVTTAPTTAPTPTAAPTPRPTSAPAPAPVNTAPRVTKSPTDETVAVGGSCYFVAKYENAIWAEWHFVSPDGSRDLDYEQAAREFPSMEIVKGYASTMQLKNIPESLDGWRVYCRFSNDNGSVNSGSALITIQGAKAPAAQRAGFEGRWAEEIAGRCQIVFKYRGEGSMNVDISWSSSAWERARWNMTANVYKNDIMVYNNAHYWVETYTDESHFTTSQDSYNGTGSFYLQDGKLHWANDQTGEDTVFVPA